jgi:hypothetical protein
VSTQVPSDDILRTRTALYLTRRCIERADVELQTNIDWDMQSSVQVDVLELEVNKSANIL